MELALATQGGMGLSVILAFPIITALLAPPVLIVGMAIATIPYSEMGSVFARQAGPSPIVLIVPLIIMDRAVTFARTVMREVVTTGFREMELVHVFPDGNCLIAWIVCPVILGQLAGSVRTAITESVTTH